MASRSSSGRRTSHPVRDGRRPARSRTSASTAPHSRNRPVTPRSSGSARKAHATRAQRSSRSRPARRPAGPQRRGHAATSAPLGIARPVAASSRPGTAIRNWPWSCPCRSSSSSSWMRSDLVLFQTVPVAGSSAHLDRRQRRSSRVADASVVGPVSRAAHTSPNPIQRAVESCSLEHGAPAEELPDGVRYCSSPSNVSGIRHADGGPGAAGSWSPGGWGFEQEGGAPSRPIRRPRCPCAPTTPNVEQRADPGFPRLDGERLGRSERDELLEVAVAPAKLHTSAERSRNPAARR